MTHPSPVVIVPDLFDAVIFDLDGVVTDTARIHFAAWKELFDRYLFDAVGPEAATFTRADYLRYVDGRPRIDGVETFLESRGVRLLRGEPSDPSDAGTAWALANRKNALFLDRLAADGVDVFADAVDLMEAVRAAGLECAVVTASRNRAEVIEVAGLVGRFQAHVDGLDLARLGLPGKPDPASFLEAARRLDVDPSRAVVIEDAHPGVAAARRGGFGLVVGLDRHGSGEDLMGAGADVVVADLTSIEVRR